MRKFILALTAVGIFGLIAAPAAVSPAQAETVIIKKSHHDRGHHYGWRHRPDKVVVVHQRRHEEVRRHHDGPGVSVKIR
jgi:hypothetical protein